MDNWRVAVLGDGGVGKTALAVQVSGLSFFPPTGDNISVKFTLNCFVGKIEFVFFMLTEPYLTSIVEPR